MTRIDVNNHLIPNDYLKRLAEKASFKRNMKTISKDLTHISQRKLLLSRKPAGVNSLTMVFPFFLRTQRSIERAEQC